jgi:hypothetical protein
MDGRIVSTTEKMMRNIYCLSENYASTTCSVTDKWVTMAMFNGLITITAKFPRCVIDDKVEADYEEEMEEEAIALEAEKKEVEKLQEETQSEPQEKEETKEAPKKPKKPKKKLSAPKK